MLKNGADYEKKYLVKNIILIFVFLVVVIVGTIFIISDIKNTLDDERNKKSEIDKDLPSEPQSELVNILTLNEIDLQVTRKSDAEYAPYNARSDKGKVELNFSSFKTDITKSGPDDWFETVKDGVIIFCIGTEKNYIEKIDTKGNMNWKKEMPSEYKINDVMEVTDGYFIKGQMNNKDIITKLDIKGNSISARIIEEKLSNINFIESEEDWKEGKVK